MEVQELWTQEALRQGRFELRKVRGEANTADMMTKPLSRLGIEQNLHRMGFACPTCVHG